MQEEQEEQQQQDQHAAVAAAQQALRRFLLRDGNRHGDAKTWLVDTLANVQEVPPAARHAIFLPWRSSSVLAASASISSSSTSSRAAELQLLHLLADEQPAAVSGLLLADATWLRRYLTASPRRISAWFGGFDVATGGVHRFRYGARALANFALAERAAVWHLLVWTGKHAQSPVAVAAKPHYFGELDVAATIANLARSCPRFWDSDELRQSCEQAAQDWLALDAKAVGQELRRLLHEPRSSRSEPLRRRLSAFLAAADWGLLCRRLLPLLPGDSLLQAARTLAAHQPQQEQEQQQCRHAAPRGPPHPPWLSAHAAFVARHAVRAVDGQQSDTQQQQQQQQQLADTATAAPSLPCVADLTLLVLQGCSSERAAGGCWTVDELLLANALTVQRGRLLQLLLADDDDEADAALAAATATAASVARAWAQHGRLPCVAGAERGAGPGLLQCVLEGWLLRLQLMLNLAAAAQDQAAATPAKQPQQQPAVRLCLPKGWSCWCSSSSSRSGGGGRSGEARSLLKARRRRSSTRKRRRRSSSSSSTDSGSDIDLDGGGQLLDPADFERALPPASPPPAQSPSSSGAAGRLAVTTARTQLRSLSAGGGALSAGPTWLACMPAGGGEAAIGVRGTCAEEMADGLVWHAVFLSLT